MPPRAPGGRAGHLANGVVLLVPEPIITFVKDGCPPKKSTDKLKLVLPEDDHCVTVSDPLEVVLDRLMEGRDADADVRYVINRMAAFGEAAEEEPSCLFDLRRSYGAFAAQKRQEEHRFGAGGGGGECEVSPDGSTFHHAIQVDRTSGQVELPKPVVLPGLAVAPSPASRWIRRGCERELASRLKSAQPVNTVTTAGLRPACYDKGNDHGDQQDAEGSGE